MPGGFVIIPRCLPFFLRERQPFHGRTAANVARKSLGLSSACLSLLSESGNCLDPNQSLQEAGLQEGPVTGMGWSRNAKVLANKNCGEN